MIDTFIKTITVTYSTCHGNIEITLPPGTISPLLIDYQLNLLEGETDTRVIPTF